MDRGTVQSGTHSRRNGLRGSRAALIVWLWLWWWASCGSGSGSGRNWCSGMQVTSRRWRSCGYGYGGEKSSRSSKTNDCGRASQHVGVELGAQQAVSRQHDCVRLGMVLLTWGRDDAVGREVDYAALTKVGGRCAFK